MTDISEEDDPSLFVMEHVNGERFVMVFSLAVFCPGNRLLKKQHAFVPAVRVPAGAGNRKSELVLVNARKLRGVDIQLSSTLPKSVVDLHASTQNELQRYALKHDAKDAGRFVFEVSSRQTNNCLLVMQSTRSP